MRIPFATQSYKSASLPLSAQRCINWFAEQAPPDAKTPIAILGTPGLKAWTTVGNGPIRGYKRLGKDLYVVSGIEAYKVSQTKVATLLGTVPGTGRVRMANNDTQMVVITGNMGYVLTTTVEEITDTDFPGASSITFLDQYIIVTKPDSAQFFISALTDALTWDALDFATAESDPDILVTAFVDHRELWLAGPDSIEIWFNSGDATFPFERQSGSFIEQGLVSPDCIKRLDNTVFWVGTDKIVYRADAYIPTRISTHAIEGVLGDFDLSDLIGMAFTQNGHPFYIIKKPGEFTFGYDVATGLWHERISHLQDDWRISHHEFFADKHLVADDTTNNIYELDPDTFTENGDPLVGVATSPSLWAEATRARQANMIIDFETGVGSTTGQGSDPQAMLRWSDDGGRTWSNQHWTSIGKIGEYMDRAKWNRLGKFRQRVFEVTVSDPVKRVILGAYAEIDGGRI